MPKSVDATKVLCVDDSPDIGGLCRRMIDAEPDMACVGVLTRADELVDHVIQTRADIVVLDLTMPGKEPLEAVRELTEAAPWCRVLAFSGHDDHQLLMTVSEAGAWGLVSKGMDPGRLTKAIRQVAGGEFVRPR
jgi:DNA-binding NarL/FixJ family response regulator